MSQTLINIRNCTSLNNLKKSKPLGQVATFLILIITGMLIFILVVANIGQISNIATNLSNAADSASLYLASQLGTESYQISASLYGTPENEGCGNPWRCCVKTGFLVVFLAIIGAVIAIVLAYFTFGQSMGLYAFLVTMPYTVILAGVIGGAIGGGIGGGIAGTGWLQGAIQGAMIGFAIGAGAVTAGWQGGAFYVANAGALFGTIFSYATCVVIGASLGAALAIACNVYSAYAKDQMLGDAMDAAVKALNGLPKKQRIRESVFLQALSQTIDDPNKTSQYFYYNYDTNVYNQLCADCDFNPETPDTCAGDPCDSDGDGDTAEMVPNFQYCWDRRISDLHNQLEVNRNIEQAIEETKKFLGIGYEGGQDSQSPVRKFEWASEQFLEYLHQAVTLTNCISEDCDVVYNYGTIENLLRVLIGYNYKIPYSFYDRTVYLGDDGPTRCKLCEWKKEGANDLSNCPPCTLDDPLLCPDCLPPNPPLDYGYDPVDGVIDELGDDFIAWMGELREEGEGNKIDGMVENWLNWVTGFYDPDSDAIDAGDYYHVLDTLKQGIKTASDSWSNGIEGIRQSLTPCLAGCKKYTTDYTTDPDGIITDECVKGALVSQDCTKTNNPVKGGDPIISCQSRTSCECCFDPNAPDFPCRDLPWDSQFGTLEPDCIDDFAPAQAAINWFIPYIDEFRNACYNFYYVMEGYLDPVGQAPSLECGLSGTNPVKYEWHDSRCPPGSSEKCLWVKVGVNDFQVPHTVTKKYGNWLVGKKCIELVHYEEEVTATIERYDPTNVNVGLGGLLGKWNPTTTGSTYQGIQRTSKAKYKGLAPRKEWSWVNLTGTK